MFNKLRDYVQGFVAEIIALVVGWVVCICILAGFFAIGRWHPKPVLEPASTGEPALGRVC
jgi:hypothetical protein